MFKQHIEFKSLEMSEGWNALEGYPIGIEEKILAGSLNTMNSTGCRTRLLRFAAGVYTTAPFVHDYWEEVFLVQGDLTVGNDTAGHGGINFNKNTYACRPPGAHHGPFKSNTGCLLLEIHYYTNTSAIAN